MKAIVTFIVVACATLSIVASARAVEVEVVGDSLKGRVYNSSTGTGVQGLSVRLIPSRASGLSTKATFTARDGRFRFGGIGRQRYVLEICRGLSVVYRKEIDTTVARSFQVALRPAAR